MSQQSTRDRAEARTWGTALAKLLRLAEEFVYILIGVLLVIAAVGLLLSAGFRFVSTVGADALRATLEILDTLIVTLVEHVLVLRPFLIIALIAVVRRVLVITAQQASLVSASAE